MREQILFFGVNTFDKKQKGFLQDWFPVHSVCQSSGKKYIPGPGSEAYISGVHLRCASPHPDPSIDDPSTTGIHQLQVLAGISQ